MIELIAHTPQSYGTSPTWDHTVLPATRHRWTVYVSPNPSQNGWYSINLPKRDERLGWSGWLVTYPDMVYPPTDGHPSKY